MFSKNYNGNFNFNFLFSSFWSSKPNIFRYLKSKGIFSSRTISTMKTAVILVIVDVIFKLNDTKNVQHILTAVATYSKKLLKLSYFASCHMLFLKSEVNVTE